MSRLQSNSGTSAVAISGGTSVFALLTVVFAAAKVMGFSDMSWIMVFSPIWASILFTVGVMLIIFCGVVIYQTIAEVRRVNILKKSNKMKNKVDMK